MDKLPAVLSVLKILVALGTLAAGLFLWFGLPIAITAVGVLLVAEVISDQFMKP